MTSTQSPVTATLKTWTARTGETRQYVQNLAEILDVDIELYKSGNIRWATLGTDDISNAEAARILSLRVYVTAAGEVVVNGAEPRAITIAAVKTLVEAAYAAAVAAA